MKRTPVALRLAGLALLAALALPFGAHLAGMHLNLTDSLPPGLYRERAGEPAAGDLVLACPPPGRDTELARDRGYYAAGRRCPGGLAPVVKTVAAAGGDHVLADRTGLRVNGRRIPCTSPLPRDSAGRPLSAARVDRVLPDDLVWLTATYSSHSFDSRYLGPWPRDALRGRVAPLWTTDDPRRPCAAVEHVH